MAKINLDFAANDGLYLWNCCLTDIDYFGGYSFFRVTGINSSIKVYIGYTHNELWICFPDFETSCTIVDSSDYFWNLEKLDRALTNFRDVITVTTALELFYEDFIKFPF